MPRYPEVPSVPGYPAFNLRLTDYDAGPTDCWLVRHGSTTSDYARCSINGDGEQLAHRIAWSVAHGRRVPHGHHVHHTCGARNCVNPRHLELLTASDHMSLHRPPPDLTRPPAGNCRHGHDWATWGRVNSQQCWVCRLCARDADRRRDAKRRARAVPVTAGRLKTDSAAP